VHRCPRSLTPKEREMRRGNSWGGGWGLRDLRNKGKKEEKSSSAPHYKSKS